MTEANYWNRTLSGRVSRRRALAFAGVAAFLAACGGGDSSSGKSAAKDSSGLLTEPQATTKDAVKGGIWPKISGNIVIYHFDPMDTSNGANRLQEPKPWCKSTRKITANEIRHSMVYVGTAGSSGACGPTAGLLTVSSLARASGPAVGESAWRDPGCRRRPPARPGG